MGGSAEVVNTTSSVVGGALRDPVRVPLGGEIVSSGDAVIVLVPETDNRSVEIFVDGNDALADKVGVNDTIIAVNGAPLGFVTDHSVLAKTIGKLSLPIRITFERYLGVSEQDSDLLTINSVTREDVEAAEAFEATAEQRRLREDQWQRQLRGFSVTVIGTSGHGSPLAGNGI